MYSEYASEYFYYLSLFSNTFFIFSGGVHSGKSLLCSLIKEALGCKLFYGSTTEDLSTEMSYSNDTPLMLVDDARQALLCMLSDLRGMFTRDRVMMRRKYSHYCEQRIAPLLCFTNCDLSLVTPPLRYDRRRGGRTGEEGRHLPPIFSPLFCPRCCMFAARTHCSLAPITCKISQHLPRLSFPLPPQRCCGNGMLRIQGIHSIHCSLAPINILGQDV